MASLGVERGVGNRSLGECQSKSHQKMKPGHLDTAIKTELGHIKTMFYWFLNLKMNVYYKTTQIASGPKNMFHL